MDTPSDRSTKSEPEGVNAAYIAELTEALNRDKHFSGMPESYRVILLEQIEEYLDRNPGCLEQPATREVLYMFKDGWHRHQLSGAFRHHLVAAQDDFMFGPLSLREGTGALMQALTCAQTGLASNFISFMDRSSHFIVLLGEGGQDPITLRELMLKHPWFVILHSFP